MSQGVAQALLPVPCAVCEDVEDRRGGTRTLWPSREDAVQFSSHKSSAKATRASLYAAGPFADACSTSAGRPHSPSTPV